MKLAQPSKVPAEVVRDLLAIARFLHAMRKDAGAGEAELAKLQEASKALSTALGFSHLDPETIGARTAWSRAQQGLLLLSEALCTEDASARVFVAAWGSKLLRGK